MSLPSVPPEEPAASGSRVAQRLLDQPLRSFGVGITALVLGSTAAFGGLEEAQGGGIGSRIGTVQVGRTIEADPFEITIRRLIWMDGAAVPNTYPSRSGDRWLAVVADIENTSDESVLGYYATQVLSIDAGAVKGMVRTPELDYDTTGDDSDRTTRVRADHVQQYADSSALEPIQPGITYSAVFLFEHDAEVPPPDEVKVQVVEHTWRADSLTQTEQWLDPTVTAEAELAVLPQKAGSDDTSTTADSGTETSTDTGAGG
ncbi:hypothetical protein KIH74_18125 [Kineosporia sp. J2-2]|uniref:DUF4352 domain-containing protein n=1 Tax=Kineosporia corallincola TaxID=2835133 RepID=A0ABS5TIE4_9ACTN|nr:hypothetical protein [Kineosporia corallincola]MBT0770866.1 hypothetical protein [Kineosporia corallincola]